MVLSCVSDAINLFVHVPDNSITNVVYKEALLIFLYRKQLTKLIHNTFYISDLVAKSLDGLISAEAVVDVSGVEETKEVNTECSCENGNTKWFHLSFPVIFVNLPFSFP